MVIRPSRKNDLSRLARPEEQSTEKCCCLDACLTTQQAQRKAKKPRTREGWRDQKQIEGARMEMKAFRPGGAAARPPREEAYYYGPCSSNQKKWRATAARRRRMPKRAFYGRPVGRSNVRPQRKAGGSRKRDDERRAPSRGIRRFFFWPNGLVRSGEQWGRNEWPTIYYWADQVEQEQQQQQQSLCQKVLNDGRRARSQRTLLVEARYALSRGSKVLVHQIIATIIVVFCGRSVLSCGPPPRLFISVHHHHHSYDAFSLGGLGHSDGIRRTHSLCSPPIESLDLYYTTMTASGRGNGHLVLDIEHDPSLRVSFLVVRQQERTILTNGSTRLCVQPVATFFILCWVGPRCCDQYDGESTTSRLPARHLTAFPVRWVPS
jgi:hypothetical protein